MEWLTQDLQQFVYDARGVHSIHSSVPKVCLDEETIMGIDEAGRGPVLGPMVYGVAFFPILRQAEFDDLKFKDSKTINQDQREKMFRAINENGSWIGWKGSIISPDYISNCMLQRTKYTLNDISHDCAIELIRSVLSHNVKLSEVYVDTVGDPKKYESKLAQIFPHIKITVSVKADSLFGAVSAASICAKVIRDHCMSLWQYIENSSKVYDKQISKMLGSGYPSDPTTKNWLDNNVDSVFGYPCIVRFSWATCETKLYSEAYKVQWHNKSSQSLATGIGKIREFFCPPSDTTYNRHRYFKQRNLKTIDLF